MDPIDEIKAKLDIVTFIQPYVSLKQSGRNFKGLCPFHGEKTPSFMVSPERQIFHCFGCQKGGDVISFYQQIENIDFYEALKSLAERTGVVLKYQEPEDNKQKNSLVAINTLTAKFYHYLLTKHPIGKEALAYLTEQRKVLPETIKAFQLGYAPNDWRHLLTFLRKHKISESQAYQAGVLSKNQRGYFDMFRDRIMFPISDHRGNIVAFAGRVLTPDAKSAKYINTPETKLYIKGNTLYGLYQNAEHIREKGSIILVEGELDVISSYQAGVKNVVAMKGTALTQNQITLLRRYTTNLYLALDQDSAGQSATRRSIELCYQAGFNLRIVSLPFGKDVDDLAKQSPKQWQSAIERASPYYDWLLSYIISRYDLSDPFAKNKVAQEALPFLRAIDNEIIREHYIKLLAKKLDTSVSTLWKVQRRLQGKTKIQSTVKSLEEQKPREIAILHHLLGTLFQSQHPENYLATLIDRFSAAVLPQAAEKELWQMLVQTWQQQQATFSFPKFLAMIPKELNPTVDILFINEFPPEILQDETKMMSEVYKASNQIRLMQVKAKLKDVTAQLAKASATDSSYQSLTQAFENLREELKALSV